MNTRQFAYEARNDAGQLVAGTITANSIEHAGQLLGDRDLFVIPMAVNRRSATRRVRSRRRASRQQVAWFMSQLSVMIETGIRLGDALECLTRQASDPSLKMLLQDISTNVNEGHPLSESLEMYPASFPPLLTALIRASEMTGTMGHVLHCASDYLLNDLQIVRRVRSALMYPAFMMLLCITITVFLLVFILPRFADIFASRHAALPTPTRMMMAMSQNMVDHWWLWLCGAAACAATLWFYRKTVSGARQLDSLVLNIPGLSDVPHKLFQSRTFRTMSILLNAGVSLADAIDIVRDVVTNRHYRELWDRVDHRIRQGEPMSGPLLASPFIPEGVGHMIASGEQSGRLPYVFTRLADFVEEEYNRAIKTATQFIEPCMMLLMGAIVGFIALALLLPLFQASRIVAH